MNELESLKQQLETAKKLLAQLELSASACTDITRPASLSLEVSEQREKVKNLESQIKTLEADTKTPDVASSPPIPFTNRDDDLRDLRSSGAPPYVLIDAPAGYGKTTLLKQLNDLLNDEDRWLSAYVAVTSKTTLSEIVLQLADQLKVTEALNTQLPWAKRLGSALTQLFNRPQITSEQRPTGVILLIDFDDYPVKERVKEVVDELLPTTQEYLATMESPIKFRVIITGRYLSMLGEAKTGKLKFANRSLRPFNFDVIRASVKEFTKRKDAVVTQLAAHLLYLTGGHPRYMAQALKMYDGSPPDEFFQSFGSTILGITTRDAPDVLKGLPEEFSDLNPIILNRLNVFRCFDKRILTEISEGRNLERRLVYTYLFTHSKGVIYDDIVRRVLAIRLWCENSATFSGLCHTARDIYAQRMQEDTRNPEKWAIEYLFQSLQQHAHSIQEVSKRRKLQQSFFQRREGNVDSMLDALTRNPAYEPMWINFIIEDLSKDWEFQFTINYYLRNDQYTEQPYDRLIKRIEQRAQHDNSSSIH